MSKSKKDTSKDKRSITTKIALSIFRRALKTLLFYHKSEAFISLILLSILLSLSSNCSQKSEEEQKLKTQDFNFEMIYTKGITEISCFSLQLIEIQREKIFPFISGFITLNIIKENEAKANKVEFREKEGEWQSGKGESIKGEEIKIEVFQDRLSVNIKSPVFPKEKTYLEIRGFTLPDPSKSCESVYEQFKKTGFSQQNVALGRSRIIDPTKKENKTKGILTRIINQDNLPSEPTNFIIEGDELPEIFDFNIAFPIFSELEENTETKKRRFMLCGGINLQTESVSRTCKIFNEETLSFEPGEIPMNSPRVFGSATKLNDGKIVISGGLSYDLKPVGSFEIFYPDLGLFLKTTRTISRFLHHVFSTERNIGIVGGIGGNGLWQKDLEVFPISQTEGEKIIKGLYILDYSGRLGSCFAENKNYVYIIGGINSRKIVQIKKERIDFGTIEAQEFEVEKLGENEIKSFGNCQALAFEQRVVGVSSLGYIFSFTVEQVELKIQGQKFPAPNTNSIRTKKGFSLHKISTLKSALFGGIDYIQETNSSSYSKQITPSHELFIISPKGEILGSYRTKYPRIGGVAILTQDEYLLIFGGTKGGKSEVLFIGNLKFPESMTSEEIPKEEVKTQQIPKISNELSSSSDTKYQNTKAIINQASIKKVMENELKVKRKEDEGKKVEDREDYIKSIIRNILISGDSIAVGNINNKGQKRK